MKLRISPVTRINGLWTLDVEISGGKIVDAWSSGIFFRGIENIMKDRDPRDAAYFTQRTCGICSTAHAVASAYAIEEALNIEVPPNAILLRNLIFGADLLQNHIRHFYLLSIPDFVEGPNIPPFIPRYTADYRLTKIETEKILQHYEESLEMSRKAHEMVVIFGGKVPHQHGIVAGGATVPPTADRIQKFTDMLEDITSFIKEKMVPDMELIADKYSDYYKIGIGHGNMFAYATFPRVKNPRENHFPAGLIIDGKVEKFAPQNIIEEVKYSWYDPIDGPLHPKEGKTHPMLDKEGAYSWVKAPRYNGMPLETGPLARLWVSGDYRRGISTMDRYVARVKETEIIARLMKDWLRDLRPDGAVFYPYEFTDREIEGAGFHGAMRGGLVHWMRVKNRRVTHYQIITPSAWNCSPRDDGGIRGPIEECLVGTPVADEKNPIEIGRVVRAFDPCLSCAIQLITPDNDIKQFQIC